MHSGQTRVCAGFNSPSWPARQPFQKALENLERHFAVVGLVNCFDESLGRIQKRMGWPWIAYQSQNVTEARPRQEQIEPAVLDRIRQLNALDIALYDWAVRRRFGA